MTRTNVGHANQHSERTYIGPTRRGRHIIVLIYMRNISLHTKDYFFLIRGTYCCKNNSFHTTMVTPNLHTCMYTFTVSASVSLEAIIAYQRLASLSDLFGSLRKPTERAEAGPYTRTFATTTTSASGQGRCGKAAMVDWTLV